MVMTRELSAILGLRTGLQPRGPDDLADRPSVKVRRQIRKVRGMAAFVNAETRAACCAPIFASSSICQSVSRCNKQPDHSARDPNLGGFITLDISISHSPAAPEP